MDVIWNAFGFTLNFYFASIYDSYIHFWIPGILYFLCFANQGLVLYMVDRFQNSYLDQDNYDPSRYNLKVCLFLFVLFFAEKFYFQEIYGFLAIISTWVFQIIQNTRLKIVNYSLPFFFILLVTLNRVIMSLYLCGKNVFMYKSNQTLLRVEYFILILEIVYIYLQYFKSKGYMILKDKAYFCEFCSMEEILNLQDKNSLPLTFSSKLYLFFFNFQKINEHLREAFVIDNCGHFFHTKCFFLMKNKNKCFKCEKEIDGFKIVYY